VSADTGHTPITADETSALFAHCRSQISPCFPTAQNHPANPQADISLCRRKGCNPLYFGKPKCGAGTPCTLNRPQADNAKPPCFVSLLLNK